MINIVVQLSFLSFLLFVDLILFSRFYLQFYINKHSDNKDSKELNKRESLLYNCCIFTLFILFISCLRWFIYTFNFILLAITIILLCIILISIVCRFNKKKKIADILCTIIIAPIIVIILVFSSFSFVALVFGFFSNNSTNSTVENRLDEIEIQNFNQNFLQYESNRSKGSTVNSLLQYVIVTNSAQEDDNRKIEVFFENNVTDRDGNLITKQDKNDTIPKKVPSASTYKVECFFESNSESPYAGLVNRIVITKSY